MWFLREPERKSVEAKLISAARFEAKIESLEREIARLEHAMAKLHGEWVYERERADRAVDSLLQSKGLAPVMPVPDQPQGMDDPYAKEDPEKVRSIMASMGLGRQPRGETDVS